MTQELRGIIDKIHHLLESDRQMILVAIDGRCGGGKTALGTYLAEYFDCNLFHMDDFFLRREQRTVERLGEVGGNVDYERFREEVLDPLIQGKTICYRPFSCKTMELVEETRMIEPKRLNVIEGSYSQHPYFGEVYDLKIFVDVSAPVQRENILRRNGEDKLKEFREKWIPKEEAYFSKLVKLDQNICVSHGCVW